MAKWVNVVGPDGRPTAVPDWSLGKLPEGFRVEAPEERRERLAREQVEGPMGQLGAAAAGAARGLTLGISDVALTHTGTVAPETLNALKLEHPITSVGSEITGAIGGAVASKKLPNPAGMTAKMGRAIEAKAALEVAGKFGTGMAGRMAQSLIPKAAGALAEGGVYGAGHLISESALGNEELTAENLIAYAGTGALLSGAAAGAFSAGGELARTATRGARQGMAGAAERVWEGATGSPAAKGLGDAWARISSVASGASKESIEELLGQPFSKAGQAKRAAAIGGKDIRAKAAGDLAEVANGVKRVASRVQEEAMGDLKLNQVKRLVKTGNEGDVAQAAMAKIAQLNNAVARHIDDFDEFGNLGRNYGKKARAFMNQAGKEIRDLYEEVAPAGTQADRSVRWSHKKGTAAARPAAMGGPRVVGKANANALTYSALDRLKRKIGAFKKLRTRPNAQELAVVDSYKKIYDDLRVTLEDEALWGNMGKAQAEINGAWANYLRNNDLFRNRFMTMVDEAADHNDWLRRYDVDPAKVERFLKDIADPRGDIPKQILSNNIITERALVDKIQKYYDVGELAEDIGAMKVNSKKLESLVADVEGKVALGNQLSALEQSSREVGGYQGALIGYGLGGVGGGVALGAVVDMAARPGRAVRMLFAMESLVGAVKQRVDKAADAFISKGTGRKIDWTRTVAPVVTGVSNRRKKFEDAKQELEAKLGDPYKTGELVRRNLNEVVDAAPKVHAAMQARTMTGLRHLQQTMPRGYQVSLKSLGETRYPRDGEIQKWLRVVRAVESPTSLIEDLADGKVDREAVKAIKVVYPHFYQQIRESLIARVAELNERLPHKSRVQLSLAFDAVLDPSMKPSVKQHLRVAGAAQMQMQQAQGGQGAGSGGKRSPVSTEADSRREPPSTRLEQA